MTAVWTAQVRGLTLGEGTDYQWSGPPSYRGWSGLRASRTPRPQRHGTGATSADLLGSRPMILPLLVSAATAAELDVLLTALTAAWAPAGDDETVTLVLSEPARDLEFHGRPGRIEIREVAEHRDGVAYPILEFEALDPRAYDPTVSVAVWPSGSSSGGLSFPHGFPHGFGVVTSGLADMVNVGTVSTYARLIFAASAGGALTRPTVENATTGERISFDVTIYDGSYLIVNMQERTVLVSSSPTDLSAASNRADTVIRPDSTWWELSPGTSQVRFTVGAGAGTLDAYWQSAWLL